MSPAPLLWECDPGYEFLSFIFKIHLEFACQGIYIYVDFGMKAF